MILPIAPDYTLFNVVKHTHTYTRTTHTLGKQCKHTQNADIHTGENKHMYTQVAQTQTT